MAIDMLPCPFCGKAVDLEDHDTLYPNGSAWMDDQAHGIRTYHSARALPPSQWCYSLHCPTNAGGCGAEIHGDTKAEAIAAWNRRAPGLVIKARERFDEPVTPEVLARAKALGADRLPGEDGPTPNVEVRGAAQ